MSFDWTTVYADRAQRMGASEIRELLKILEQPDIISFAGGIPDPALLPVEAFQHAYAAALGSPEAAQAALQYSLSDGLPELRRWIADYMAKKGVPCEIENILITSGSQQGLEFIGRLLLSPGDPALVAWPTYLGALQAFNAYEPAYIRLDPRANAGRPELPAGAERAKFAYIVPDFANPTGETLTVAARQGVLAIAESVGAVVVEDAAYTELRYDGDALPSLLALDAGRVGGIDESRVIYCGTFSKTLSPGLRVGWVAASRDLIEKLVLVKQASDLHSAPLNQIAIARVAEAVFDDQVEKNRAAYRTRRDAMLQALTDMLPKGFRWSDPDGGMFVWVEGPPGLDCRALLQRAVMRHRVAFVPGQAFFADGSGQETMRLSFSLAEPEVIREGVARLAAAIADTD